jgi:hypothetical protein
VTYVSRPARRHHVGQHRPWTGCRYAGRSEADPIIEKSLRGANLIFSNPDEPSTEAYVSGRFG